MLVSLAQQQLIYLQRKAEEKRIKNSDATNDGGGSSAKGSSDQYADDKHPAYNARRVSEKSWHHQEEKTIARGDNQCCPSASRCFPLFRRLRNKKDSQPQRNPPVFMRKVKW